MAEKIGNIVFPNGKYIKDGEEKTSWMRVGVLIRTEKGLRIKLDAVPTAASENGLWLSVFEEDSQQRQQQTSAPAPSEAAPAAPATNPDIPF